MTYEEEINGKILKWRYSADGSEDKGLVWLDADANKFLTQELFTSLRGSVRAKIESVWAELKIRMISYIEKAREYKFHCDAGWGYTWSVSQIAQADVLGNPINENHPMVEDARHLVREALWLNAEVERFKTLMAETTHCFYDSRIQPVEPKSPSPRIPGYFKAFFMVSKFLSRAKMSSLQLVFRRGSS